AALNSARRALAEGLSPAAVSAASAVAANFTKNDRIANGLGIPIDPMVLQGSEDLRAQLGLNDYRSAVNTFRHATAE
ncbi:MAG: alkylhydroperoxidase-related (seleno)protein, partial [Proteobacteria bacterium]|nr:alkylhydroperoxidase-related (seleno)protein [Pseudomonadota bacterium]